MSTETSAPEAATESVSTSESQSAPITGSSYSVTDPGYSVDAENSDGDTLAALIEENKPESKPSETLDDASESNDGNTEEGAETQPTVDDAADPNAISDELLDRARELGYTIAEIKGFRSQESLEKEVSRVETLQKRMQERQAAGSQKPAAEDTAPVEEVDPEPDWDAMIEEGHDPVTVEVHKKSWQRAAKAEALVQQLYKAEQDRVWEAQCERFDSTLNGLGEGYKTLFGEGRRGDLLKTAPEAAANRDRVFQKMAILKTGYERAGIPAPTEAELIQEAVQASFHKQTKEITRAELKADIKKAGSQALSRPRSAGAKPLSGSALASAKEEAFWKKHS